jgi:hypothetical protein
MDREKNHTWVKALALAAVLFGIGKCMRLRAWRMAEGADGECPAPFHAHARRFHKFFGHQGHKPPWFVDWEKPSAEAEGPVEVAVENAAA